MINTKEQFDKYIRKLATVESAIVQYHEYNSFDELRGLLNNSEYDTVFEQRFNIQTKYQMWSVLRASPVIRKDFLWPYVPIGFRCYHALSNCKISCVSFLYAYCGDFECIVDGIPFILREHETCICNTDLRIDLKSTDENGLMIHTFISKTYLNNNLVMRFPTDALYAPFFEQALHNVDLGMDRIIFQTSGNYNLEEYLLSAMEAQYNHTYCADELTNSFMFLFMYELLLTWQRQNSDAAVQKEHPDKSGLKAYDIINYISDNFSDVTIKSIAEHFHFQPDYMRKAINRLIGKNFVEILYDMRLSAAEKYLRETDMPIVDIIHAVGYQNMNHFYKLFKSRFKCAPAEYREKACHGQLL